VRLNERVEQAEDEPGWSRREAVRFLRPGRKKRNRGVGQAVPS
jgi:hypothetical protein